MYAIYIAIQFWTSSISNKRVQLFCDNQSCVEILNRGTGRDQEMLNLARQIWYLCASSNVQLRVSYIASVENRLSDLLSRWNLSEKNRSQFFIESKLYNSDFIEKEVFGHMFNDIININSDFIEKEVFVKLLPVPIPNNLAIPSICSLLSRRKRQKRILENKQAVILKNETGTLNSCLGRRRNIKI
ncbi:unnamed protein product [Mytilus edulis]|uniref:Uncharacterized protein n=1 Tax=Mytilus edulis TaxID=6550 RepID=A0A8S3QC05_MYTED|nr:unnamed protein product [Mytilus edulis]